MRVISEFGGEKSLNMRNGSFIDDNFENSAYISQLTRVSTKKKKKGEKKKPLGGGGGGKKKPTQKKTEYQDADIKGSGSERIKLFVGQIPRTWEESEVRLVLEPYGAIEELTVLRDRNTKVHKGEWPLAVVFLIVHGPFSSV